MLGKGRISEKKGCSSLDTFVPLRHSIDKQSHFKCFGVYAIYAVIDGDKPDSVFAECFHCNPDLNVVVPPSCKVFHNANTDFTALNIFHHLNAARLDKVINRHEFCDDLSRGQIYFFERNYGITGQKLLYWHGITWYHRNLHTILSQESEKDLTVLLMRFHTVRSEIKL